MAINMAEIDARRDPMPFIAQNQGVRPPDALKLANFRLIGKAMPIKNPKTEIMPALIIILVTVG